MSEKRRTIAARAGVIDSKGVARAVQPRVVRRLDHAQFVAALVEAKIVPTNHHIELTPHVLLSARTPWVDGKGHLDTLNPRSTYPEGPGIHFVPENGQPVGRADAWLDGLDPNSTYLARISVGSPVAASFDVRAVTLGGGFSQQTFQFQGGFDELFLDFDSGDGGIGLIRVECPDWSLYELEVSRFDS